LLFPAKIWYNYNVENLNLNRGGWYEKGNESRNRLAGNSGGVLVLYMGCGKQILKENSCKTCAITKGRKPLFFTLY